MAQFQKLEGVFHNRDWRKLVIRDTEHTPYNFRKGERKAAAKIEITDMRDTTMRPDPWTQVTVTEFITGPSGRVTERTISITLDERSRAALREYLA